MAQLEQKLLHRNIKKTPFSNPLGP